MAKAEQSMESERGGGGGAAAAARAEKIERRGRLEPIVLSVDLANPLNMAVTLEEVRTKTSQHTKAAQHPSWLSVALRAYLGPSPRLQHTGVAKEGADSTSSSFPASWNGQVQIVASFEDAPPASTASRAGSPPPPPPPPGSTDSAALDVQFESIVLAAQVHDNTLQVYSQVWHCSSHSLP